MISKFSVKKPYTVIVGVVMVLLLGVISFMNSTTDLLPTMELPYVVIYTSYPGASAEKVETSLTKVLESSIATTENLNTMSSVSSDNISMIVLEFIDDTNMDRAMIDLNAKIDLVKGMLDEKVGNPTLLALNPNMMPIISVTADYEGKDIKELSTFVQEVILPEIEKTSGVASVDTQGLLKETVEITMDQEKIDELNYILLSSVDRKLADAEKEVRQGLKQVNEALTKVKTGQSDLSLSKDKINNELTNTGIKLQEAATNLIAMSSQITQLEAEKAVFNQIVFVVDTFKQTNGLEGAADEVVEQVIVALIAPLEQDISELNQKLADLNQINNEINLLNPADVIANDYQLRLSALHIDLTGCTNYQDVTPLITIEINAVDQQLSLASTKLNSLNQLKMMLGQYVDAKSQISVTDIKLETAKKVKQTATDMLVKAGIDVSNLSALQAKIDQGLFSANSEFTKGEIITIQTQNQLEETKIQLENALKDIEKSRDETLDKANLSEALSPAMISNILMAQNFSMPAGTIATSDEMILLRIGEEYASIEELQSQLLISMDIDGLRSITLNDVATVRFVDNKGDLYTKINGNDGIIMSIQKTATSSTSDVSSALQKRFELLETDYEGLHFYTLLDQGVYIDLIISSVLDNFLYGALLAILVLIVFLKNIKPTIVIALSIPISLMFAIVLMYFSNVTLNVISLSGLALGVGMLVDNSVVVVENIYRLRSEGVSIIKASIEGAKEVSGAIIASTLTTVCVFLPIVFATGLAKQLFVDMGLTIAYSLLASLIVALTLVPMLSSKLLVKEIKTKQLLFNKFVTLYEKLLRSALKHKIIVLSAVVGLLMFSIYATTKIGMTLIPPMNSGQMSLNISPINEDLKDEELLLLYDEVMTSVQTVKGVKMVGVSKSSDANIMEMGRDSSVQNFYIITEDNVDYKATEQAILNSLKPIEVDASLMTSNMDLSALGSSGVGINLYSNDLDDLHSARKIIIDQLKTIDGIEGIVDEYSDLSPDIRVIVDKNKAMSYGLTVAQVYQAIASNIQKDISSISVTLDQKDYPIVIIKDETSLINVTNLKDALLSGTKDQKSVDVRLDEIATITNGTAMNSINRHNSKRLVTINASIYEDYNITHVTQDVKEMIDISKLPNGVELVYSGENESIMETMGTLVLMILLAIVFIYMIMVAQFQSLLSPFIVMFTIPLAFTGGILALVIFNMELSIVAMLGFLVLCGVVVNNGIVFIDYTNQLRNQGFNLQDALIETGKKRLRPILMTALTTILAMTTMALGIGEGSEMMQGMAVVTIGGLTYATLLTLIVVPVMYDLFNKKRRNMPNVE